MIYGNLGQELEDRQIIWVQGHRRSGAHRASLTNMLISIEDNDKKCKLRLKDGKK